MAKEPKKLDELFHDTLKDIYFAEKKILTTLPKMEKAAHSPVLKKAFAKHRTETEGHVERLEKVFAEIDKKPQGTSFGGLFVCSAGARSSAAGRVGARPAALDHGAGSLMARSGHRNAGD